MVIAFETPELRTLCEGAERAEEILGQEVAAKMRNRLLDLRAAKNFDELLTALGPLISRSNDKEILFRLPDGYEMRVRANHNPPRLDVDGSTNWTRTSRIKIISIARTHA